ncbi:MAG: hypothetical protein WC859_06520 [Elusimicrobiota bacterium]|jgi:hypothetical protein
MNWKRIGVGTLCAFAVFALFDIVGLLVLQKMGMVQLAGIWGKLIGYNALPTLLNGFLLCWLYVLARPRLGPGLPTALLTGTVAFALANDQIFNLAFWARSAGVASAQLGFSWVKYVSATSLAGWQYIEKAQ